MEEEDRLREDLAREQLPGVKTFTTPQIDPAITQTDSIQSSSRGNWMNRIRSVPKSTETAKPRDLRSDDPSPRALAETRKANEGDATRLQVIDAKLIDFTLRGDRSQSPVARDLIRERTILARNATPAYREWSAFIAEQAKALASG